jgi:GAF domain-containing protein
MKRRSRAGGEPTKERHQKTPVPKRRYAPKAARRLGSPTAEKGETARLTRELNQAQEHQAATSEVLKVISSSNGDLQQVFATMLEKAVRICDAKFGNIYRWDGHALHLMASHNIRATSSPNLPGPQTPTGRMIATKAFVHVPNLAAELGYAARDPWIVDGVELVGVRTLLILPMLKENELIGAFIIYRQEICPFTDTQIEILKDFATQAVIAIENAQLLNELRQRTTDLTEALEQQTATSEVLRVISSSAGVLQPVFERVLENATRLCHARFGNLFQLRGDEFQYIASHGVPSVFTVRIKQHPRGTLREHQYTPLARMVRTKKVVHVIDLTEDESYRKRDANIVALADGAGARTIVVVPMFKEGDLVGAVAIYRQEVHPFTENQIELVKNFAAQAVIAIENARLLNELRQSLEQQTATAEVLGVISRSRFELQPVLQSVVDTASRLCRAKVSGIWRLEGGRYRLAAVDYGTLYPAYDETQRQALISPGPGTLVGRAAMNRQVVQIEDAWTDPLYEEKESAKLGGVRSMIGVPLMREGEPIGVLGLARTQVEAFAERDVELVRTFADQAVIAIENARLLNELRERTDQLQAQSKELAELNQQLEHRVSDQVGEIERVSRLRRFLPPQVADLIVASGSEKQLESHRREITALFCDLRGFTGFSESADPEDVMTLLREYHQALGASIIKYSGTLERYAGDGVMVVFNDPVPVENPALQAVLMALEMREAIGALTETWRRWGHEIGFGIGIAHGFATLGTIGFEGRFDYAAIGTVSNVASRLCDEAKPGQILISPRVLTKVESAVKVEPVGEFELKGIRRPLAAYNVIAAIG